MAFPGVVRGVIPLQALIMLPQTEQRFSITVSFSVGAGLGAFRQTTQEYVAASNLLHVICPLVARDERRKVARVRWRAWSAA